jgi:hypothetical protein
VSRLLRAALSGASAGAGAAAPSAAAVAGFRPFAAEAGHLVNNEQIDRLRDAAGL